jgi:beta-lactamase class A
MFRFLAVAAVVMLGLGSGTSEGVAASGTAPGRDQAQIPETPVGEQIEWILDQLAADEGPEPAEVESRFAEVFLAAVGPDQLIEVFGQLRMLGPWTATGVTGDTHAAEVPLRTGTGEPWVMTIALESDGRIHTLFVRPDPAAGRTPAKSFDALTDELRGLADHVGFLAARVEDGTCTPVAAIDPTSPLPLGSTTKLYVLGALAEAVADGTVSWEDTVTVTDEVRSLPSGRLQDAPSGTEVTVREAAQDMIAISDNTATDLLIRLLGRDRVEAAVATMGHADPDVTVPFLTTREYFLLGWGDPDRRQAWAGADRDARRAMLDELASAPLDVAPSAVTTPAWPDGIDWFASPHELCAAHLALQERAAGDILAANPGIAFDHRIWPHVGFKGGSAPGIVTGSWYAEHATGGAVVVVFQLASVDAPVDPRLAFTVAADAFTLLAKQIC